MKVRVHSYHLEATGPEGLSVHLEFTGAHDLIQGIRSVMAGSRGSLRIVIDRKKTHTTRREAIALLEELKK